MIIRLYRRLREMNSRLYELEQELRELKWKLMEESNDEEKAKI